MAEVNAAQVCAIVAGPAATCNTDTVCVPVHLNTDTVCVPVHTDTVCVPVLCAIIRRRHCAAMRARGSGCKRRPLHLDAGEETEVEDCQCILLRLCSFAVSPTPIPDRHAQALPPGTRRRARSDVYRWSRRLREPKRGRGCRLCQTLIGALHTDLMHQELGLVVPGQGYGGDQGHAVFERDMSFGVRGRPRSSVSDAGASERGVSPHGAVGEERFSVP